MSATEIIDQIKHLPSKEKDQVISYVRELKIGQLSGEELEKLAERFVEATDPAEVESLRQQLTRGFYGD